MRVFVALDIDDAIRARIARFLEGVRGFAPEARWVRPESLHVTLKFIGERPEEEVDGIKQALKTIESSEIEMNIHGYGFFPGARAPRVFWIGIEAGTNLNSLAAAVDETLVPLDIAREEHAFNPHLTLARAAGRPGSSRTQKSTGSNTGFHRLQDKLAALPAPEFGTMTSHEFFLYQSRLSPGGSKYTKLAEFGLQ